VADLLVAPYLPAVTGEVGPWQLVAFSQLAESDSLPAELRDAVLRLVQAYSVLDSPATFGVVLHQSDGRIGAAVDPAVVPTIGRALLAGAIANNPRMAVAEEEVPANAGHAVLTSENALVYGHPNLDPRSYAIETGRLTRVRSLRAADLNEPLPKIAPPTDLPTPMFGRFDIEMANATYGVLAADSEQARRLDRGLGWYTVFFSNSEAIGVDVPVGAARSALEVMTGSGDSSREIVRAVGRLLDPPDTPRKTFTPEEAGFGNGPIQLSPTEWWLARFCILRNELTHGDTVPNEHWVHEGHSHLDWAHDKLIDSLREIVAAESADDALRETISDRAFIRARKQALRDIENEK
jgi:hypothetical protein